VGEGSIIAEIFATFRENATLYMELCIKNEHDVVSDGLVAVVRGLNVVGTSRPTSANLAPRSPSQLCSTILPKLYMFLAPFSQS
jgi:hypothetical protein